MEKIFTLFITTQRDAALRSSFDGVLRRAIRRKDPRLPHGAGNRCEQRLLLVTGESGAGKTTAIEKLLHEHPALPGYGRVESGCPVIGVTAPAPCTLHQLGRDLSAALGYPYVGGSKEAKVWEQVRRRLKQRRIILVYIDELQHLTRNANVIERDKVRDTLKLLLIDKEWPVSIMTSGLPEVEEVVKFDPQVRRRKRVVRFEALRLPGDISAIADVLRQFAKIAGLGTPKDAQTLLTPRLIHAADYAFGTAVELTQEAIEAALLAGTDTLDLHHFADAYAGRTGCEASANPFLAARFIDIDTSVVREEAEVGNHTEPKRRGRSKF
jgi:hypothetical protein